MYKIAVLGGIRKKQLADIISKQLISLLMLQERPSSLAKKSYLGRTNHHTLQDFRNIPEQKNLLNKLVAQDKTRPEIMNNRYASLISKNITSCRNQSA